MIVIAALMKNRLHRNANSVGREEYRPLSLVGAFLLRDI